MDALRESEIFHLILHKQKIKEYERFDCMCGLDCENCDARKATVNNDDALREKTAKQWAEANDAPIKPEHISCMGCRTEGVKYLYCSDLCPVRKCVSEKGYDTCADCAEIDACEVVAQVFKNAPEARGNLKTERLATE